MKKFEIVIQPIGDVPPELVGELSIALQHALPVSSVDKPALRLPKHAYNPDRRQYLANHLLRLLENDRGSRDKRCKVLGLTTEDIFAPGRTFVFGQAIVSGQVAVISTCRLDYDSRIDGVLIGRTVKEAIHEIGHTLGLQHCDDSRCVMSFSESLAQADTKGTKFCRRCLNRLAPRVSYSRASV